VRDVPESDGSEPLQAAAPPVRFAGLVLDLDACTLARQSGEAIALTRGEFTLLRVFVTRPGRVVGRDALLDAMANRRFEPFDRSVDVLIGRLRRKIEPDPKEPRLIVTVPGEGYRFDGLTKISPYDQKPSIAALASLNDEQPPERDTESGGQAQERVEGKPGPEETHPTPADQAMPPAIKPRFGFLPLAAAIAAIALLATGGGWFLVGGRVTKQAQAPHLSIVVLPFANLSGDPAQDYFVDGVTENLTTQISRMSDSLVIARNTAFTYKGRNVDAKEIGRGLGVRYALEGSVQRDQGRMRVNAQLIDTETGAHLWADVFDEDVADLLKAQDQVVARLARALGPELVRAEAEKGAGAENPDAVDLAIRGWDLVVRANRLPPEEKRETFHQARGLFDRALQIDPNDPLGMAGSAETYLVDFGFGWRDPGTDYEAKVLGQANRAIVLNPSNIPAYYTKAMYLSETGRPSQALDVTDVGLAINPNDVLLYMPRASSENALGRFEQARADAERAMWLSPRDFLNTTFLMIAGDAEINLGDFDAAVESYRKALDSGFREFFIYARLSAAYAEAGKIDEAKAALAEARRLNPKFTVKSMIAHMPNWPAMFDGVRKAGLPEE
jgi:TolB-like protein/DNA-binding winged helix-turn-helix (wHTH) protein